MDKEESSDGNVITGRVLIDTFLRALPTLPMKTLRKDNNYLYCKHFASAETKQALECYLCDSIRAPLRDAIIILHLQLCLVFRIRLEISMEKCFQNRGYHYFYRLCFICPLLLISVASFVVLVILTAQHTN